MKTAIILGTRPEIIKMSPVIRECQAKGLDYFILHSGQHYSHNLDRVFFEQLELPEPKYNLGIGSGSHAEEMGKAGRQKIETGKFSIEKRNEKLKRIFDEATTS